MLFFNVDFRCAEGILGTILVDSGFFGIIYFEDVRCAEGIPGSIR